MALEPWLHFFHILGAIIWLGGGLMLSLVGSRARQSGDISLIRDFARMLSYVGLRVLTPAVFVLLVSGIWLVLIGSGWNFKLLWVLLGIAAFVISFLIGAVYLSRNAIQLERAATQTDVDMQAVRDLLGRWMLGYRVILVILFFAVWDMVFKPGF